MVDTIIFRVHDLHKNAELLKYLHNVSEKGKSIKMKEINGEDYDPTREVYLKRYFVDHYTGKTYSEGYSGFIRSSNYDVAFYVNYNRDFISFNLSLPKFYFGNNIIQLIDHWNDSHFVQCRENDFWNLKHVGWERFKQVLNFFFENYCDGLINKNYIQIVRIDICYNLVFREKDDCLYYLKRIQEIRRKKFSDEKNFRQNYYSDGLYFKSRDMTFKVYHKGNEFKANSYNKYKKRFGETNADTLHKLADCILRFEIELNSGSLTTAFLSQLKETNKYYYSSVNYYRQFQKNGFVNMKYKVNNEVKKEVVYPDIKLNEDGSIKHYSFLNPKFDRHKQLKKMIEIGKFIMKKDIQFSVIDYKRGLNYMGHDDDIKQYDHVEPFDFDMFSICIDKFKEHFMHFNLGDLSRVQYINQVLKRNKQDKIFQKNLIELGVKPDGISDRKLALFINMLSDHTMKQIKDSGYFPSTTFYRYKKIAKKLGLKEANIDYNFNVSFNYKNYYDLIFLSFNKLAYRSSFN